LNCSQLIRNSCQISREEDVDVEEDIARVEIADLEIQMEVFFVAVVVGVVGGVVDVLLMVVAGFFPLPVLK
jgi:hypothetical protein